MSNELQELLAKKKEIERQIKALSTPDIVLEDVKFGKQHYPTSKKDDWFVAVKLPCEKYRCGKLVNDCRWAKVLISESKADVIDAIEPLAVMLMELKKKIDCQEGA